MSNKIGIFKFLQVLKGFMDGTAKLEDVIKTFLPAQANLKVEMTTINPMLTAAGVPDNTEFVFRLTTVHFGGKEWLALLLIEKE